jgi:hypothetical protein
MKKAVLLAVAMVLAAAPVALADSIITIPDLQEVRSYQGANPVNYGSNWMDVIGQAGNATTDGFNTSKIVLTFSNPGATYYKDLKIDIFTNFPQAGNIGGLGDIAADMILSLQGGTNNYGIALTTHGGALTLGTLYKVDTLQTSVDRYTPQTNLIYGGAWQDAPGNDADPSNLSYVYMTGSPTPALAATSIVWGAGDGVSKYDISIFYAGYNNAQDGGLNTLTGFWCTGDCSNDAISFTGTGSPVPLPPSVLLMGSGLLGLALLGKRQLSKPE